MVEKEEIQCIQGYFCTSFDDTKSSENGKTY